MTVLQYALLTSVYCVLNVFQNKVKPLPTIGSSNSLGGLVGGGIVEVPANDTGQSPPLDPSVGAEAGETQNVPAAPASLSSTDDGAESGVSTKHVQQDYNLVNSLLNLTKSPVSDKTN